jgi:hypothetical protein
LKWQSAGATSTIRSAAEHRSSGDWKYKRTWTKAIDSDDQMTGGKEAKDKTRLGSETSVMRCNRRLQKKQQLRPNSRRRGSHKRDVLPSLGRYA